nr:MAG TPA: hypothetical protein [Bacteriophage sp.]
MKHNPNRLIIICIFHKLRQIVREDSLPLFFLTRLIYN